MAHKIDCKLAIWLVEDMLEYPKPNETGIEIGVDEAGRGCLWGSMFAAAVLLETDSALWSKEFVEVIPQIKDSKKVTAKRRKALYELFKKCGLVYGIGEVTAQEIDKLGATRANQIAFRRAIDAIPLEKRKKSYVIIDGILPLNETRENEESKTEVDGDARFLSIATASILAKEAHDEWVQNWVAANPAWGSTYCLLNCKGYGTEKHRKAIVEHGLQELHRRLYCRKLIPGLTVTRYEFVE